MNRQDFIRLTKELESGLGPWKVVLDQLVERNCVVGCYYNQETENWTVYDWDENGRYELVFNTKLEFEAWDSVFCTLFYFYKKRL